MRATTVKLLITAFIIFGFTGGYASWAQASNEAIIKVDNVPLPDPEQPWKKIDLKGAGILSLPGQPKIMTQNKTEQVVNDFFRGVNTGRCVLLQAVYGGAPERKPRAALMALSFRLLDDKKSASDEFTEKPIGASLENSMGAFEDSFLPFMKRGNSQSFEVISKQIQTIDERQIFMAEYSYDVAATPHITRVALFKHQGRLYIILLEALKSDEEFWQKNFPEIIAKWTIPSRDGYVEPEKSGTELITLKPDNNNKLKPLLGN